MQFKEVRFPFSLTGGFGGWKLSSVFKVESLSSAILAFSVFLNASKRGFELVKCLLPLSLCDNHTKAVAAKAVAAIFALIA